VGEDVTIEVGQTFQLTAFGLFDDESNEDISDIVTWGYDPNIISVTGSVATGLSRGQTGVSPSYQDVPNDGTGGLITVIGFGPRTMVAIENTVGDVTIPETGTTQLTALGVFDDDTTQDISDLVTWTYDTDIINVDSDGVAFGLQVGVTAVVPHYEDVPGDGSTGSVTVVPA
jgi:hypothetical protein